MSAHTPIPRRLLFGNPDRALVRLSPGGSWISYLAPDEGVLNVWVAPADRPDQATPVTQDRGRGIHQYTWAHTDRHILYQQDADGDENWRVYSVDVETKKLNNLTPLDNVQARIQHVSPRFPHDVLIGLNDRDARLHDLYRVNIETGAKELVEHNEGFLGFMADDDFAVRFALRYCLDGGTEVLAKKGAQWETFIEVSPEDSMGTQPAALDATGSILYMIDSRARDTAAAVAVEIDTGNHTLLAEDPKADASAAIVHPTTRHFQAVGFTYKRRRWEVLDSALTDDLQRLEEAANGELSVVSRTTADDRWIVAYDSDHSPTQYHMYERTQGNVRFLFSSRQDLDGIELASMHPTVVRSRDGFDLVSYLTLPRGTDPSGRGRPERPLPMVLLVHGGPWGRDHWGFDAYHQWLADRGYAVLSVNFRGSTGFGKRFVNAGDREWAGAMHDDLVDAVDWAVGEKIADRERVAIMGGSYGGYATLVGLTFTPELFACGVDIVGPSNLITLLNNIPPYWAPMRPLLTRRVGDPESEHDKAFLRERSPLTHVDKIQRPLLIGQGANDPRVKKGESDQIVEAMEERGIPVTYILYPDEGHGFVRPENRLSFFALTEAFLAEFLGGSRQPWECDLENASLQVLSGAEHIPGLSDVLSHGSEDS